MQKDSQCYSANVAKLGTPALFLIIVKFHLNLKLPEPVLELVDDNCTVVPGTTSNLVYSTKHLFLFNLNIYKKTRYTNHHQVSFWFPL